MTRIATKDYQIVEVEDRIWTTLYEKWPGLFTPVPGAPQAPVYFHNTHEALQSMIDSLGPIPDPEPDEPDCGSGVTVDAVPLSLEAASLLRRINQRTIATQQKVDGIEAFLKARFK